MLIKKKKKKNRRWNLVEGKRKMSDHYGDTLLEDNLPGILRNESAGQ